MMPDSVSSTARPSAPIAEGTTTLAAQGAFGRLALAVQGLGFRYSKTGEELFSGLTHSFAHSATTALTGASGSGKSTLLYVLGLMLRPSAGVVLVGARAASTLPDVERSSLRASRFGFVFQDSVLDPTRSVLEAVMEPALYSGMGREVAHARALRLADQFGLSERIHHRPGEISGGQAQRVAIARALLGDPAIILADEPTGNLDRGNAAAVLDALIEASRAGRTVIIATHDPYVRKRCDDELRL